MSLNIYWALKTKQPNDLNDYRVLASAAGPFGVDDVGHIFEANQVGNIPDRANDYDPLAPWFTFSTFQKEGNQFFTATRLTRLNYSDNSRRNVALMACLCIPYAAVERQRPDITTTANLFDNAQAQVFNQALQKISENIVSFEYQPFVMDESHLRSAESSAVFPAEYFDFLLTCASLLLTGPLVIVVPPNQLSTQNRLDYLNAILNLLPYGARSDCPISTWTQSNARHTMRLSFSSLGSSQRQSISWNPSSSSDLTTEENVASKYYRRARRSVESQKNRITGLIQHLARQSAPLLFSEPNRILRTIDAIDPIKLLANDIATGKEQLSASYENPSEIRTELMQSFCQILINPTLLEDQSSLLINILRWGATHRCISEMLDDLLAWVGKDEERWHQFLGVVYTCLQQDEGRSFEKAFLEWASGQQFPSRLLYKWVTWCITVPESDYPDVLTTIIENLTENPNMDFSEERAIECLQRLWGLKEERLKGKEITMLSTVGIAPNDLLFIARKRKTLSYVFPGYVEWWIDQLPGLTDKSDPSFMDLTQTLRSDIAELPPEIWAGWDILELTLNNDPKNLLLLDVLKKTAAECQTYIHVLVGLINQIKKRKELAEKVLGYILSSSRDPQSSFDTLNRAIILDGLKKIPESDRTKIELSKLEWAFVDHAPMDQIANLCLAILIPAYQAQEGKHLLTRIVQQMINSGYPNTGKQIDELLAALPTGNELVRVIAVRLEAAFTEKIIEQTLRLSTEDRQDFLAKRTQKYNEAYDYVQVMKSFFNQSP